MKIPGREFGSSGIFISSLGFGAGQIDSLTDIEAAALLNNIIDLGISFIDTARGYGSSEEKIGKHLSHRRSEFILSTKVGYGIQGFQDWTYDCIIAGIDKARTLMRTDYIDIVHLHSCPKGILINNGVIDALDKVQSEGKIRIAAYSGENEDLTFAVESGRFGGIQTSVNICDQQDIDGILINAKEKGSGVIAKRPLANAPWKYKERPYGQYVETYWLRWKKMNLLYDINPLELFIRFAAFAKGVDTAIAGSKNIKHIKEITEAVSKGPLPMEVYLDIRNNFNQNNDGWNGEL